jgi:hypothetical protein
MASSVDETNNRLYREMLKNKKIEASEQFSMFSEADVKRRMRAVDTASVVTSSTNYMNNTR